ncbi:hypothetical protein [Spiroplasma endosymbiont of Aspidapion aeneum]|uniref:hypothetical protein n=1 Tax=Spiroplasma endosymbiont of Aspidapion aeneum TaxID=3066276 RepID=UPI00313D7965
MEEYKYKVLMKNDFEAIDEKALIYLYQPIIGLKSLSVYKFMIQESFIMKQYKNINFDFSRILKILSIKYEALEKCLKFLEAMGLVQRLSNKIKKNVIVFNIFRPLDPIEFFENTIFNSALRKKIGFEDYEIARLIFSDETNAFSIDEGFTDNTTRFYDVFSYLLDSKPSLDSSINFSIKLRKSSPLLNGFDENIILKTLKEKNIDIDVKNHEQINILKNVYSYIQIDNVELANLLVDAYDNKNKCFDKEKIQILTSKFIVKTSNKPSNFVNNTSPIDIKLNQMNSLTPELYISCLMKKEFDDNQYNELIGKLRNNYVLPDPVINCILDFSYIRDNKNIIIGNVLVIAEKITRKNILTSFDTMKFLKEGKF